MPQLKTVKGANTSVYVDGFGYTVVKYHDTIPVRFNHERIILSKGNGSKTVFHRMLQAAAQYKLGYTVKIQDGVWYVVIDPERPEFTKAWRFPEDGKFTILRHGPGGTLDTWSRCWDNGPYKILPSGRIVRPGRY